MMKDVILECEKAGPGKNHMDLKFNRVVRQDSWTEKKKKRKVKKKKKYHVWQEMVPLAEHVYVFLTNRDNEVLQSICPGASAARKQAFSFFK